MAWSQGNYMAFEEFDDIEQERLVKQWLKDNWLTIVAGIALGIGGIYAYNFWVNNKVVKQLDAAEQYTKTDKILQVGELSEAEKSITELEQKYGASFFSAKSRMELAKSYIDKSETQAAIGQYEKILSSKPGQPIAEVSRLRLARLMVAEKKYDKANELLNLVRSEAYKTVIDEVRGDIFYNQGEVLKAADAYQLALNSGEGYSGKNILEMKIADIRPAE